MDFINLIHISQNTFVGLLSLAALTAATFDSSHLNLHHPHTYHQRTSYDDVVDPIYPPLGGYHHTHSHIDSHGYDMGLTSSDEYAADLPHSFDHQISGHEVNDDLGAHSLDFQNEFDTLTSDYRPVHEELGERYETPKFENTVFHQVPAPRLGRFHYDTEAQDFSDLPASQHYESHGRSLESVHGGGLFTPHYGGFNTHQHSQYTNSLLKK